jgi:hypothetical protein
MNCEKCINYSINPDGTNEGYYTACNERELTASIIRPLTKEEKQEVMDGKIKSCRGFKKL